MIATLTADDLRGRSIRRMPSVRHHRRGRAAGGDDEPAARRRGARAGARDRRARLQPVATGPAGTGKRSVMEAGLAGAALRRGRAPGLGSTCTTSRRRRGRAAIALLTGRGPAACNVDTDAVEEGRRGSTRSVGRPLSRAASRGAATPRRATRAILEELQALARTHRRRGLEVTPAGVVAALVNGEPIAAEEFLSCCWSAQLARRAGGVRSRRTSRRVHARAGRSKRAGREEHQRIDREVALFVIGDLVEEAKQHWGGSHASAAVDGLAGGSDRVPRAAGAGPSEGPAPAAILVRLFRRRLRHPLRGVRGDHVWRAPPPGRRHGRIQRGRPVGRIEYETVYGAAITDHWHVCVVRFTGQPAAICCCTRRTSSPSCSSGIA